jgi:site-specific DNA-methyltransferase (adenine-specific)
MGKEWDGTGVAFRPETWAAAFRVAKPGAYLLAFGGTRTVHRMTCAIEDAGWIIRDMLVWGYASGFPKGRANLKPAWEPIVMARKPGPLAMLNIDGCRISAEPWQKQAGAMGSGFATGKFTAGIGLGEPTRQYAETRGDPDGGRWPANLILTDPIFDGGWDGVVGGGETAVAWTAPSRGIGQQHDRTHGKGLGEPLGASPNIYGDSGTYSRFFLIPKAARSDREPVLGGLELLDDDRDGSFGLDAARPHTKPDYQYQRKPRSNSPPTVKPVDLMRHLVRLVTPSGGTVLDPFLGSGTTGLAAEMEGFAWIGIEKEAEYVAIAEARLNGTQRGMAI